VEPFTYYYVQLTVISRILRNLCHSCITLCHIECRKYFQQYFQDRHNVLFKITWPCEDWRLYGTLLN